MSALPARFQQAQIYRAAVINRENAAIRFLASSWQMSMHQLQIDIDKMTRKIEQARLDGVKVNKDWLRRQQEYKRLQSQIIRQTKVYSEEVAEVLGREVDWAARKGAADAAQLTQMSFDTTVRNLVSFRQLPEDTILNIAGRVTPKSPTGKILGKLGRDASKEARKVLIDGITRGRNVRVIARDLQRVTDMPRSRSLTIARTEIFGAYRDTHMESMKENEAVLEGWVWMAQIGSACGGCLSKHGSVHEIGGFFPAHPNCHCEPVPKPKSWASMGFPSSMDDEFPDTFDPKVMQAAAEAQITGASQEDLRKRFGIAKGDGLHSGKFKLDQLATQTESKVWGPAIVETPLKNLVA